MINIPKIKKSNSIKRDTKILKSREVYCSERKLSKNQIKILTLLYPYKILLKIKSKVKSNYIKKEEQDLRLDSFPGEGDRHECQCVCNIF